MEGTSRIESPDRRFEEVRLSSEGSENRNSRVLEALDTSEPLSLQAALDQILSLPDLAGLTRTKRPRPNDIPILPPQSKRRREHSPVDASTLEDRADQSTRNNSHLDPSQSEYHRSSTDAFVFGGRSIRTLTRETFTGNVFEYDDPWKAAGIVLV
ncbi:hypothetical protein BDZ89DRAFT_739607 [Hymenopellis radicata]|nr:hypothetical protein BDZ89DRAFT_739607 [Hymenopellis radicata]